MASLFFCDSVISYSFFDLFRRLIFEKTETIKETVCKMRKNIKDKFFFGVKYLSEWSSLMHFYFFSIILANFKYIKARPYVKK